MDTLERLWELVTLSASGTLRGFERAVTSMFGSSNARYLRRIHPKIQAINALESHYQAFSDAKLAEETVRFRQRLAAGETLDDILVEAFAVCREGGRRFLSMRHYDVQLVGGMVLHSGSIAEMVTGEGKTLVATLPAYLNALEGKGVHVVTVNDYLARRDMEWMAPLYMGLGLTVGAIQSDMEVLDRQKAYSCDITYGTNNEFGFDYLRDNMRPAARGDERYPKEYQQSQGRLHYAIIDEVDNILIDEARTPLIISGPSFDNVHKYADADRIARQLIRERHFVVNEKDHSVNLTEEGVRMAEKLAGVESFYTAGNMEWPHLIDNSLKAHYLYKRDVNYVVDQEGKVVIVDEFTGRLMQGRQWSDGLHQAVEAKEGVKIKEETQTLATITLQNFFKLYRKICGMTGTAMTEANEFWKIYKLDVIATPTNKKLQRKEFADVIYRSEREKFEALAEEIERLNRWDVLVRKNQDEIVGTIQKEDDETITYVPRLQREKEVIAKTDVLRVERKGRPVLVGTVSIEKSERLSHLLKQRGINHQVLNAKYHRREAEIVAQAGRLGAVTIATNMAGRGTDIVLGGNPETMAWARLQDKYATRLDVPRHEWNELVDEIERSEKMKPEGEYVRSLGGLHVIGTERHEARRIDLQLRGRTGRQGDPGSSRFYLSLEDDLMRIFAGPWVKAFLERLGMEEGDRIESGMVTRRIEGAQKKVEERHFEARKNLLEYDEVMDQQRKQVYTYRQRILDGVRCRDLILESVRTQIEHYVETLMNRDFGLESFAAWAGGRLSAKLEPKDFRGMDFTQAEMWARQEAERAAETQVMDALDENLPDGEDTSEWNWEALANVANARWGTSYRDRDLKKVGRDGVSTVLLEAAHAAIAATDLAEGEEYLDEKFGAKRLCGLIKSKFDVDLAVDDVRHKDNATLASQIHEKAVAAYDDREARYPVMAGFYQFSQKTSTGVVVDGQAFLDWARTRFDVQVTPPPVESIEALENMMFEHSRRSQTRANELLAEQKQAFDQHLGNMAASQTLLTWPGGADAVDELADWMHDKLQLDLETSTLIGLSRQELELKLSNLIEDRFRPEIRRMERRVLLEIVDDTWKNHLLAMDHLRSSVGLKGYAQMDPKVEYKREGVRLFKQMWQSIGERVIDLVYRMEALDDGFVRSTWVETSARHDSASSTTEEVSESQRESSSAADSSRHENIRIDPIRNRGSRAGRNDPCPCGSGKKFKNCCMRKSSVAS